MNEGDRGENIREDKPGSLCETGSLSFSPPVAALMVWLARSLMYGALVVGAGSLQPVEYRGAAAHRSAPRG
ncbi:MAG TPA: hypothetical protein VN753_02000 [Terracidiphilus sp.]|nr:hypothetical protein [Terracidiphilus sp.]